MSDTPNPPAATKRNMVKSAKPDTMEDLQHQWRLLMMAPKANIEAIAALGRRMGYLQASMGPTKP